MEDGTRRSLRFALRKSTPICRTWDMRGRHDCLGPSRKASSFFDRMRPDQLVSVHQRPQRAFPRYATRSFRRRQRRSQKPEGALLRLARRIYQRFRSDPPPGLMCCPLFTNRTSCPARSAAGRGFHYGLYCNFNHIRVPSFILSRAPKPPPCRMKLGTVVGDETGRF
jgi:hypothetical protein